MNLTDITVTRTIPAPAEKIFDLWIDPKSPGGPWFGTARVIMNPVVDGLFYSAVQNEGRTWPHYGRFLRLDRPNLIEHTWVSEATKGVESVVTLTMQSRGNETEVTLRHSGVPDDEMGRRHKDGWTWILDMLAQGMAARRSASSSD
ncbi:MAG: SRPBCC domain-containing protein [Candidatus Acidiferrales bacterium]